MISSTAVIATEWLFVILALSLVVTRTTLRIQTRQYSLWISDGWIILGACSALGLVICDTLTYRENAMDDFTVVSEFLMKVRFATNYLFDVGIYYPKFSMLGTYFHVIPPSDTKLRVPLYIITGITVSGALITLFADTFWCGINPSVNWSLGDDNCTSFTSMELVKLNWSFNFTTEVLILLFPIAFVHQIQLPGKREKMALLALFTLGLVTVVVSTARFIAILELSNDISMYIWFTVELCVAVMAIALTALRSYLRKVSRVISMSVSNTRQWSGRIVLSTSSARRGSKSHNEGIVRWVDPSRASSASQSTDHNEDLGTELSPA